MFLFDQEFSSQKPNAAYVAYAGMGPPACPSHIWDVAPEPLESLESRDV